MPAAWITLADLVLSGRCLVCSEPAQTPGEHVCRSCRLPWQQRPRQVLAGPRVFAVHPYDRVAQRVILAVKEEGRRALEPLLAEAMAIAALPLLAATHEPVLAVPVPSRASARRRRGADVLWSITLRSARLLTSAGWPVYPMRLLAHQRTVRDQSGLDAVERSRNMGGSMCVRRSTSMWEFSRTRPMEIEGATIMVMDDLVTTGATIREAIRVLSQVGRVLGGACAASTALASSSSALADRR